MSNEMQHQVTLTDEQLEMLVEKVTEKVIENVYISIGKNVVKKFFWIVGISTGVLLAWLSGSGHIK
jgi:hypothetical protein